MAINSGNRNRAQSWSRASYDAFGNIHGLRHASATNGNCIAYAFHDRARRCLESGPRLHEPLNHPQLEPLLLKVADAVGYASDPGRSAGFRLQRY